MVKNLVLEPLVAQVLNNWQYKQSIICLFNAKVLDSSRS